MSCQKIYLITNNINGKKYVGRTKKDIKERFRCHKSCVNNNDDKCPQLHNAMREFGVDNFSIEEILRCDESMVKFYEKKMIMVYNTIEDGYNITEGQDLPTYISYVYKDGEKVGYCFTKSFVDKPNITKAYISENKSMEEKYKLICEFRDKIVSGELTENYNKFNRTIDLPQFINYVKDRNSGEYVGYSFIKRYKDKPTIRKQFIDKNKSMEEKYKLICEFKKQYENDEIIEDKYNRIHNLPQNIYYVRKNGINVGYKFQKTIDGKKIEKKIINSKKSMEEKYKLICDFKKTVDDTT